MICFNEILNNLFQYNLKSNFSIELKIQTLNIIQIAISNILITFNIQHFNFIQYPTF